MKIKGFNAIKSLLLFTLLALNPQSEAKTSSFQTSLELLGPGIIGGFLGSYRPIDNLGINLGLSFWSAHSNVTNSRNRTSSTNFNAFFMPVSVSWLSGGKHNVDLAAGATFYSVNGSYSSDFDSGTGRSGVRVAPMLFAGYRLWKRELSAASFHLRAGFYGTLYPGTFFVWPGVALGVGF